jgi:hypothetical protein
MSRRIDWRDVKKTPPRNGDIVVTPIGAFPITRSKPTIVSIGFCPADLGFLDSFVKRVGPRSTWIHRTTVLRRAIDIGLRKMYRERCRAAKGDAHA